MNQCTQIMTVAIAGVGGYYAYIYLKEGGIRDMNLLGASNESELMGYLNGLVRGAGSFINAQVELDEWKTYWVNLHPKLVHVIQTYYNKGVANARVVYGV